MKRLKKWLTILPVILVTAALGLSSATAMAAEDEAAADNPDYPYTGSLAIVAPRIARENQQISMTVFLRWDQSPFEGAGVWAFTRDQAETVREEIRKLSEDQAVPVEEKDYEALASVHGTFIGTTGADGKLYYSFENKGGYLLAAVKRGYYPGFTTIFIGSKPRAMAIDAPKRAAVDETVTMTVTDRSSGVAVADAGIWALTRENAETFSAEIKAVRESAGIAAEDIDYETLAGIYGEFLGRTDLNGQLNHAFSQENTYLLVSVKPGYIPGRTPIRVGEQSFKALVINAPRRALVGDEVTMNVYDRATTEAVEGAGVWALTRETMDSLQADMKALREDASIAAEDKNYESLMDIYGQFIGRTDGSGQVTHAFSQEGGYLLVTVKQGYFPAWTTIRIVEMQEIERSADGERPLRRSDNATGLQKAPVIDTEITQY